MGLQHFVFGYGSLLCQHSRAVTAPSLQLLGGGGAGGAAAAAAAANAALPAALPVVVDQLQRVWGKRSERGMTSLGVRPVEDDGRTGTGAPAKPPACTGVLVPTRADELALLDEREQGYERVPVTLDRVHRVPFLPRDKYYRLSHGDGVPSDTEEGDEDRYLHEWLMRTAHAREPSATASSRYIRSAPAQIWTYVPLRERWPDPDFPICQSYVVTILRGCLDYSTDMAHDFVASTIGWSDGDGCDGDSGSDGPDADEPTKGADVHWVEDRRDPIYPRGDPAWSLRHAAELDALLATHRPWELARRVPRHARRRGSGGDEGRPQ